MASSPPEDETAGMGKTNRLVASRDESNLWGARPEKNVPSLRGLEIRIDPVAGEVFFLDFPLYRTYQGVGTAQIGWNKFEPEGPHAPNP
jgi:hypothetical protein